MSNFQCAQRKNDKLQYLKSNLTKEPTSSTSSTAARFFQTHAFPFIPQPILPIHKTNIDIVRSPMVLEVNEALSNWNLHPLKELIESSPLKISRQSKAFTPKGRMEACSNYHHVFSAKLAVSYSLGFKEVPKNPDYNSKGILQTKNLRNSRDPLKGY